MVATIKRGLQFYGRQERRKESGLTSNIHRASLGKKNTIAKVHIGETRS